MRRVRFFLGFSFCIFFLTFYQSSSLSSRSAQRFPSERFPSEIQRSAIWSRTSDLGSGLGVNWLGTGLRLVKVPQAAAAAFCDFDWEAGFTGRTSASKCTSCRFAKAFLGLEMASTGLSVGFLDRLPLLTTVKPSSVGGGSVDALALDPRARYSSRVMRFQEARSFSRAVWYLLLVWFLGTLIVRMGIVG